MERSGCADLGKDRAARDARGCWRAARVDGWMSWVVCRDPSGCRQKASADVRSTVSEIVGKPIDNFGMYAHMYIRLLPSGDNTRLHRSHNARTHHQGSQRSPRPPGQADVCAGARGERQQVRRRRGAAQSRRDSRDPLQHSAYLHHAAGRRLPAWGYCEAPQGMGTPGRQSRDQAERHGCPGDGLHMLHQG